MPVFWRIKLIDLAPSYSLLRMEEHPPLGGDTAWVSQYGLYDELSSALKKFAESLHAVHTSRLQCTWTDNL
jgi:alpha-ketoglutarate-dependent taurine dioxygenase